MRKIRLAMPLKNHTSGRKIMMEKRIGLMIRTATVSGAIIPMRFGVKSANRINRLVTSTKEQMKLTCSASSGDRKRSNNTLKVGEKAASPTIPPRMATAFRPICTTVKKMPGVSCSLSTLAALTLPSSAISFSLILREAAREISDSEKNALTAIRKRISKILFNIIYPYVPTG